MLLAAEIKLANYTFMVSQWSLMNKRCVCWGRKSKITFWCLFMNSIFGRIFIDVLQTDSIERISCFDLKWICVCKIWSSRKVIFNHVSSYCFKFIDAIYNMQVKYILYFLNIFYFWNIFVPHVKLMTQIY